MTLSMERMPIAEAAARTGLSVDTLRYYEKAGLADPPQRDSGGRRRYSEDDVGWLLFITRLRATGMPIRMIQEYAALRHAGDASAPRRKQILVEHQQTIRAQIDALAEAAQMLDYKIANYARIEQGLPCGGCTPTGEAAEVSGQVQHSA